MIQLGSISASMRQSSYTPKRTRRSSASTPYVITICSCVTKRLAKPNFQGVNVEGRMMQIELGRIKQNSKLSPINHS